MQKQIKQTHKSPIQDAHSANSLIFVYFQNYSPTSFFRYQTSEVVWARVVRFVLWDTSGSLETSTVRALAYREADVFLLCYSIADPGTLLSCLEHWVPELRLQAPATPIILVGCQSDRRTASNSASSSLVTSGQALAVSQQLGAVMYVETSARTSRRAVSSVMEVAALTSLGQLPAPVSIPVKNNPKTVLKPPSPPISKKTPRGRSVSSTRDNWDGSLRSNSSTLSSTRSDASMSSVTSDNTGAGTSPASPRISINTSRTPKTERRTERKEGGRAEAERMVSIKCQRLRPDKTYEEVEIEVPEAVYNTMRGEAGPGEAGAQERGKMGGALGGAMARQIKCLFSKTDH